jgi:hypothetical protein
MKASSEPQKGDILCAVNNWAVLQADGVSFRDWDWEKGTQTSEGRLYYEGILRSLRYGSRPMTMHFTRPGTDNLRAVCCWACCMFVAQ